MAKGNDAADAIRKIVRQNEQLILAAEVLDEYGSFDNAVNEAKTAYNNAKAELDDLKAKVTKKRSELTSLEVDCKAIVANAENEATEIIEFANKRADGLVDIASTNAANVKAGAAREAADVVAKAEAAEAVILQRIESIKTENDALLVRNAELVKQGEDAEKRLNKVVAELERMLGKTGANE